MMLPLIKGRVAWIFDEPHYDIDNIIGVQNIKIKDVSDILKVCMKSYEEDFAEKVQDGFEYIWVSFFLFDGKREAWLQPGVKANIKGALSVSVFNDKLDFSCRVSEMSEYVPQPYNG